MKNLADEIVQGLEKRLSGLLKDNDKGIWSVCICGSYPRGDFIPYNSDLDICVIFKPGREAAFPIYDACNEKKLKAIQNTPKEILNGRKFYSHHPSAIDWPTLLWEWIPKTQDDIKIPLKGPNFRYFNIFLFDYIKNLCVLWGNDPRDIMPEPLPMSKMVQTLFQRQQNRNNKLLMEGNAAFMAFGTFLSIQVAQIIFGEETIDKRNLLSLYKNNVPDFPLKDFGCQMIEAKANQRFPDKKPEYKKPEQYMEFENQLREIVLKNI